MKYFIDTNVFLRVLIADDEKSHQECTQLLQKVQHGEIEAVTSSLVMAEIVWTLGSYYEFSKKEVIQAVQSVLALNQLGFTNQTDDAIAISLFSDHKVKYIDACIASIPEILEKKWTIISYDRDFDKLPVKWKKPDEV